MPVSDAEIESGHVLWDAIVASPRPPGSCDAPRVRAAARRLARYTAPSVAAWLAEGLAARVPDLIKADDLERARQFNRFTRARARVWFRLIADAGIDVLALKGFATATRFYPDPHIRGMGDVDLLVRPGDVGRLCDLLEGEGFCFIKSHGTPPWGLSSESSFHPFVAGDGSFSFDIHIAADDYPVPRVLSVDHVFAESQMLDVDGVQVRAPADDHLLMLAITNAGRDKFGPDSLRSMTDVVVALTRARLRPDWGRLTAVARVGGFLSPVRVAVNLLAALGLDRGLLPGELLSPPAWPARNIFDGMVRDYLGVFAVPPTRLAMQMRDWLLISSPGVLAHRNYRRLRGLARPWPGVPQGRRLSGA